MGHEQKSAKTFDSYLDSIIIPLMIEENRAKFFTVTL